MKENTDQDIKKVTSDCGLVMLNPSCVCSKIKSCFYLRLCLYYDEHLLSGQPPLSSQLPVSLRVAAKRRFDYIFSIVFQSPKKHSTEVYSFCQLQLFRERLSETMCTRQSRKVTWDMINTLFLTQ